MKQRVKARQRGGAVVEMALIFFPMMFLMLSTFELGRGMWSYHTLTTAVKSSVRFAVVHGADCMVTNSSCQATAGAVATVIQREGIGLDPGQLQVTLTAGSNAYACGSLTTCLTDTTQWPPSPGNAPGMPVTIAATYAFQSVLSSFWPGQGTASLNYTAKSTEIIQF